MRFFKSRDIPGRIKQTTIARQTDGWFLSVIAEEGKDIPAVRTDNLVGIDIGVRYFLTTSEGQHEDNPLYFRRYARKLATLQRRLSRKKRFSKNWSKEVRKVARVHSKIAHCRQDYLHKVSTAIAKSHGVVVEDLRVRNMSKSASGTIANPGKNVSQKSGLNRAILDSAWGAFFRYLEYKCMERGHLFLKVTPNHTSQTCSRCGCTESENRTSISLFRCIHCGHCEDADVNAAKIILEKGLAYLRGSTPGQGESNASGVRAVA